MAKQMDVLKQFETLHRQLIQEREEVRNRLAALNEALNHDGSPVGLSQPGGRASLNISAARDLGMREAIQQATNKQPLSVREIVAAIQQLGFRFKSKNPYNSVGAYLYGKEGRKYFTKTDGRFSALGSATQAAPKSRGKRTRTLSAAGRRAIAEAARKRWAKYKSQKSKA